jgi:hypothetical protein
MELTPHYKGTFEAFRHNGKQYARLNLNCGYVWFTFDFFTESYQSLDNELNSNPELNQELENAYRKLSTSIEDGLDYRHKAYANSMKAYRQANPNWEEQQLESENYAKEWMESSARALEKSQNTRETSHETL